jgi:hypothetical protein
METSRGFLRHTLATLAYRATRALEEGPESFSDFAGAGRHPIEILAHMGDLLDWALSMAQGHPVWRPSPPLAWPEEQKRFYTALATLDRFLASDAALQAESERLFQGPIADALTHVGQLAMLRRLAGAPTRGENFYAAAVRAGQVGSAQPAAIAPFKARK